MRTGHDIVFKTSEPAYVVDHGGQIVAWNEAAEDAFGYQSRVSVGKKCWELLCGQDTFGNPYCSQSCPVRCALLNKQTVNRFRLSFMTAAKGMKEFNVSVLMLRSGTGRDYVVHLCRDGEQFAPRGLNGHANGHLNGQAGVGASRGNLTRREHEVLSLLANGKSTREISSACSVSVHTVRNHVQHILNKLQVGSRLEAITVSQRLDIL